MFLFLFLLLLSWRPLAVVEAEQCSVSGKEPSKSHSAIRFCSMFQSLSCCDPAIDSEIQGYYNDMIGVSELCSSVTTLSHVYLRYLYCYACSPHEPKSTNATTNTISICPGFADYLDPGAYDNCGLAIPGERGNICAGDDIIMPSMHYAADDSVTDKVRGRTLNFLNDPNGATPPYFEDFQVEICDESDKECLSRCFDMSSATSWRQQGMHGFVFVVVSALTGLSLLL